MGTRRRTEDGQGETATTALVWLRFRMEGGKAPVSAGLGPPLLPPPARSTRQVLQPSEQAERARGMVGGGEAGTGASGPAARPGPR